MRRTERPIFQIVTKGMLIVMAMIGSALGAEPEKSTDAAERAMTIRLLNAAKQIDTLIEADCKTHSVTMNPIADDVTYCRRVYLDIVGRIPSYEEITAFINSKDSAKRYKLIDTLMDSPGHVSHSFNYWADLLRVKTRLTNQVPGTPYADWLKQTLRDNTPYDRMVTSLITAEGRIQENGAAGYYLRDSGMPLDNLSNTIRIFLGTQVGCAQCHDHPFDKWTQREFYEMAAYTFGTDTRTRPKNFMQVRNAVEKSDLNAREQQIFRNLIRTTTYAVHETSRKAKLPDDYKYKDAKPGTIVEPRTLFGDKGEVRRGENPRQVLAAWMTSPSNPRFTHVIANRMWDLAMGAGVVMPLDDFNDETKPANPLLMDFLVEQMKSLHYDLNAFQRMIFYTRTYQRQATPQIPVNRPYRFPGPLLKRMTAEQLWDSMLVLIVPDIDGRESIFNKVAGRYMEQDISEMTTEQVMALARQVAAGGRGAMMSGADRASIAKEDPKYHVYPRYFVRASDWKLPADPGHFLQQFGQSDRELITRSDLDPTITQALAMLNGDLSNWILDSRSLLMIQVANEKTLQQKIDVLFLGILGRKPTAGESAVALRELNADPKQGHKNVAWALLNTREFMYKQ